MRPQRRSLHLLLLPPPLHLLLLSILWIHPHRQPAHLHHPLPPLRLIMHLLLLLLQAPSKDRHWKRIGQNVKNISCTFSSLSCVYCTNSYFEIALLFLVIVLKLLVASKSILNECVLILSFFSAAISYFFIMHIIKEVSYFSCITLLWFLPSFDQQCNVKMIFHCWCTVKWSKKQANYI